MTIFVKAHKIKEMKKIFLFLIVSVTLFSCSSKKWVMTEAQTSKIAIDSTTDKIADKRMTAYIAPLKVKLDKEMNQVIGQSDVFMKAGKPESLLSNWNADVYKEAGSDYLKQPIDVGIVNMGGLRSTLPKGDITVRDIFQLMPFDNELTILWLKGNYIKELADIFAQQGGQGVSGLRFEIKDKKAQNITVDGKPLDLNKVYTIATNDYVAAGNDYMTPLTKAEKKDITGLKIRNILMEKVIRSTQNGEKLHSELDGRIKIVQ